MNQRSIYFEEIWTPITQKSVPNVKEGYYQISDQGRVFSNVRNNFLQPTPTWNGYYRVCLRLNDGTCRYYLIHRIMMIEFNFINNYDSMQVNHFDGNKSNNNIWNLEWNTASQNITHAFKTGLKSQYKGEDCSCSTITNSQAENIASLLLEQKYTHKQIADIIGCSKSVVSDIATGSTWKDIYNKYNLNDIKKKFVIRLDDNQLHVLCKYWQDHKNNNYKSNTELFKESLINALGIEYSQNMSPTLTRLFNKQTRFDIVSQYDF